MYVSIDRYIHIYVTKNNRRIPCEKVGMKSAVIMDKIKLSKPRRRGLNTPLRRKFARVIKSTIP